MLLKQISEIFTLPKRFKILNYSAKKVNAKRFKKVLFVNYINNDFKRLSMTHFDTFVHQFFRTTLDHF